MKGRQRLRILDVSAAIRFFLSRPTDLASGGRRWRRSADLIVVTGGAGYIGSHVVRALRTEGADVLVVDDLRTGYRESIGDARLLEVELAAAVVDWSSVEAVYHFAASTSVEESVRRPDYYRQNCFEDPKNFLEPAIQAGVKIIFSSTAAVYGEPERIPIREDDAKHPVNPYGENKLALENFLLASGSPCTVLRYFNAAGGAEDHRPETHLIPLLISSEGLFSVFGNDYPTEDGTCIRDYVHIDDLARAHLSALRVDGVFNLGSGNGYSVLEILTLAGREPRFEPRRAGDPARLIADIGRAHEILNWQPELGVDAMIESAREWRARNPNGYRG